MYSYPDIDVYRVGGGSRLETSAAGDKSMEFLGLHSRAYILSSEVSVNTSL